MVDTLSFLIRSSGTHENQFYIDYMGYYKVTDISKLVNVDPLKLSDLYIINGAVLDQNADVFYFGSHIAAQKTISDIFSAMRPVNRGRSITFTNEEIEYIRMALINDGSGNVGINSKLKTGIFKKLNG